jgi:prepilin signal peptidase PulO-like enzyme (type II secretory pathway)
MMLAISVIVGGITGILINYFSDVLPVSRHFTRPLCKVCDQPYSVKDYLVSYKCSSCGNKTSSRFFIVLFCAIVICVLIILFPFSTLGFWATLPILIYLGVILIIDIEHHAVLMETSLFGMGLFLFYGILLNGLRLTLFGALAGFLLMLAFFLLGLAFSKIIGKLRHKEIDEVAFGFGDVSFGLILGLLTGWPLIIGAITISMLAFTAFTLVLFFGLILSRRYNAFSSALPFTPFLILGAIVIFYL